jgi:chorismate mutase
MTIAELRVQIDALDRKLVELLDERGRLAQAIGKLKQGSSLPIYEADREAKVIAHAQAVAAELGGRLPPEDVRAIFERMIRMMRELQRS